jgi:hypothetical protein
MMCKKIDFLKCIIIPLLYYLLIKFFLLNTKSNTKIVPHISSIMTHHSRSLHCKSKCDESKVLTEAEQQINKANLFAKISHKLAEEYAKRQLVEDEYKKVRCAVVQEYTASYSYTVVITRPCDGNYESYEEAHYEYSKNVEEVRNYDIVFHAMKTMSQDQLIAIAKKLLPKYSGDKINRVISVSVDVSKDAADFDVDRVRVYDASDANDDSD